MQKREQHETTKFLKWAKKNLPRAAVFEVKHTRGKTFFSIKELEKHQRAALRSAKTVGFPYKIPDTGYQNPFDAVLFRNMDAYLVIIYPSCVAVIDIDAVPASGGLPETIAKEKATYVVALPLPQY